MKTLEVAPNWAESFKDPDFFKHYSDPEVIRYVSRMNDDYYYWSDLKRRPLPENISLLMAWGLVKLSRNSQMRFLDFISNNGKRFSYWLPDGILKELHHIDQNAAGQILIDQPFRGSDREKYIISSLMEEAIASSILEGAATTRKKAKEMLREGRKPRSRGEQMIHNNYGTMKQIKENGNRELSIEFLCELQRSITEDTLEEPSASGRLRNPDEPIHVVDLTHGTVLHVPPPAEELKERLKKLCDFANQSTEQYFVHPVIKASILHFWLAYEHPFVDGNGRTARAIFYWYLLKNNYWLAEYLPISRIILKAPAKYKMAFLFAENDDEDITYFIKFQTRAFRLSIEDLKKYVGKKQEEMNETTKLLRRLPGLNHRQQGLISHAIRHSGAYYTIQKQMSTYGVVYQTARTDLLELVKRGLFTKARVGHSFFFVPQTDLEQKLRPRH